MKIRAILAVSATALVIAGCGTTGTTNDSPPEGSNGDKASAAAKATEKPKAANPTFGEAYTWKDGITIKISQPESFKPSEYSVTKKSAAYLKFNVRLINKTGEPFDPALVYATLQSGNEESEPVFDSENGIGNSPSTKLLDGREVKWIIGFGVKDPKDLVLEISPDAGIQYTAAIFTNH